MSKIEFQIVGQVYEVSDARDKYVEIVNFCNDLSEDVANTFLVLYNDEVTDAYKMVTMSETIAKAVIHDKAKQVVRYLMQDNICSVTSKDVEKEILNNGDFFKYLKQVNELYDEINYQADEAIEERRLAKEERSRWEGGGFGISGAIKGAASAGALNAASVIGYSIVNGIGNMATEANRADQLKALYKNTDLIYGMAFGLASDVANYFIPLGELLEKEKKVEIEWVTKDDARKARRLLSNINNAVNDEQRNSMYYEILKLDPNFKDCYKNLLKKSPKEEKINAIKMASYFGVDLEEEIDNIFNVFKKRKANSLEDLESLKSELIKEMDEYGVKDCSALKDINNRIYKCKYDNIMRNIKNVRFVKDLDEIKEQIDFDYFSEGDDGKKINEAITKMREQLCSFKGVLFSSEEEKNDQQRLYNDLLLELKKQSTIEEINSVIKKIEESDLHHQLSESLCESANERIFPLEMEKYKSMVKGDIYSLSYEECLEIIPQINSDNFNEKLLNSVKEEIAIAQKNAEFLYTAQSLLDFFKTNNIAPSYKLLYTLVLYYLDTFSQDDKEKGGGLSESSKQVYKAVLKKYRESFVNYFKNAYEQINDIIKSSVVKSFYLLTLKSNPDFSFEFKYNCDVVNDKLLPILAMKNNENKEMFWITTHYVGGESGGFLSEKVKMNLSKSITVTAKKKKLLGSNKVEISNGLKTIVIKEPEKLTYEAIALDLKKIIKIVNDYCLELSNVSIKEVECLDVFKKIKNENYTNDPYKLIDFAVKAQSNPETTDCFKKALLESLCIAFEEKVSTLNAEEAGAVKEYLTKQCTVTGVDLETFLSVL